MRRIISPAEGYKLSRTPKKPAKVYTNKVVLSRYNDFRRQSKGDDSFCNGQRIVKTYIEVSKRKDIAFEPKNMYGN